MHSMHDAIVFAVYIPPPAPAPGQALAMVVKRNPTHPDAETPSLARAARSFRCMLQGLPSNQQEAMPTCALSRSCARSPVAMSIACELPCTAGWVIFDEYLFSMMPESYS